MSNSDVSLSVQFENECTKNGLKQFVMIRCTYNYNKREITEGKTVSQNVEIEFLEW